MILKILAYLVIRILASGLIFFTFISNVDFFNDKDFKNGEDYFYILWMFGIPLLLDVILFTPIFLYILKMNNVTKVLLLGLVIIIIDYLIGMFLFNLDNWFLGIKFLTSIILFIPLLKFVKIL